MLQLNLRSYPWHNYPIIGIRINWTYKQERKNEIVLDAGCGSGKLTKILSIKVPQGKVIAVDSDLSMIRLAKENLAKFYNTEFIKMDISEIELEEKVDVVFSNATLHWILNHRKMFEHFS